MYVCVCKCGNHPLHCPLDFLLNCAGQRNASTHSRAPLILLDLLEIYFPHMWEVLGGWVGVAGRAREIVLATVYRLSLFVLWFKNCTFWQHLFMYPIVQLRSVLLPFVRDAWQLLPLTAGRAQAQAQAHGSRIRHLPLARVLNASPWCHCVCSSCSCCLLVVGCLLLFLLADKVFPINPETRATWKFECDSVLWLPPAAAAWNRLTATSGLFKIESRPSFAHLLALLATQVIFLFILCLTLHLFRLSIRSVLLRFFVRCLTDTSWCLLTYYRYVGISMTYRLMKLTRLQSFILRFDVPRLQLPFSQYFVVSLMKLILFNFDPLAVCLRLAFVW